MMMLRWLARFFLVVALGAVFVQAGSCQPVSPGFQGGDKLLHVGAFFVLALLADVSFPAARFRYAVIACLVSFGVAIEVQQYMLPWRCFSLLDLAADVAGIGLYYIIVAAISK
ncbi:MAG: VanZ family protein [Prosthecochloris sp.]|nr:VanZ family protein [Prosthecochloris sp.]